MAAGKCRDCGREWKQFTPNTCTGCGHNIGADLAAEAVAQELPRVACGDCGASYPGGAPRICSECGHNIASDPVPLPDPEPLPVD